jgi:hypothetical protein
MSAKIISITKLTYYQIQGKGKSCCNILSYELKNLSLYINNKSRPSGRTLIPIPELAGYTPV